MQIYQRILIIVMALILAACGGGGGSGGRTGGTNPPPPPPPPPPTDYDTAEYRANWGLGAIKAIAAYDQGLTGQGVLVAVIDSGIQTGHVDLDDNLHPASKDMIASRNQLDAESDHGTFVAGIIVAEKNDFQTHGVAFDAQVLALRTDEVGSCAEPEGCAFTDATIASAVDYAVAQGAQVINISLGGPDPNLPILNTAISNAVAAGVIIVVSAGNEGENNPAPTMPEGSALSYIDAAGAGQIILAGSIAPNEALSDFSNPAGSVALYANAFAVAPGELVIASLLEDNGTYSSWQLGGTSFAAPHIAGAAAILLQAFPTLTAEEVVEILLTTAVDLGAPGVDPVFGNGLIDLAAALSPQGTQSISVKTAGGVEIFNLSQSGLIAGPAFGDVFGSARGPGRAVFLDSYDRAYGMNLGDRSRATSPALNFEQILAAERNYAGGGLSFGPNNHLSIAVERTEGKDPLWFDRDALGQDGRADFKTVKLGWTSRIGHALQMSTGLTSSLTDDLGLGLDPMAQSGPSGFLNHSAVGDPYLQGQGTARKVALEYGPTKDLKISFAAGSVDLTTPRSSLLGPDISHAQKTVMTGQLSRERDGRQWSLRSGYVQEDGSVLGTRSTGAMTLAEGATTLYLAFDGAWPLAKGLNINTRLMAGTTRMQEGGPSIFANPSNVITSALHIGLNVQDLLAKGDRIGLSLAQPLRVEAGHIGTEIANHWDYETEQTSFVTSRMSLVPSGRETDIELSYKTALTEHLRLQANLLHQIQPGHDANADPQTSLVIQTKVEF